MSWNTDARSNRTGGAWKPASMAGELNRRVELQSKTVTYDSYNQPVETWATIATVWAFIITSGGGEFFAAQKVNADTEAVFKIRYRTDVTVENRIKYGDRIFQILAINESDAGHREIKISAKEVI
jgi:SPP1 family predicted phage head-tail adaptor